MRRVDYTVINYNNHQVFSSRFEKHAPPFCATFVHGLHFQVIHWSAKVICFLKIIAYIYHHLHQSVLSKGRWSFTATAGNVVVVMFKGRSSTANSRTKVAVLLGVNSFPVPVASRCFPQPTLPLSSEKTLKDLKRSQEPQRGGEESRFGSHWTLRTSPKFIHELSISSIRGFEQSRDAEIPITFVDPGGPVVIILASGSEVRGFDPGRGRWSFQSVKILSMTSFWREVKRWVPCRRFTACKRTSSRN